MAGKDRNVQMEDGRIVVGIPFAVVKGCVAGAIYALVLYALLEDGFPHRRLNMPYFVVFAISTAVFVWFTARLRRTTVFDAAEKRMRQRNLLWTTASLDFADISEVVAVTVQGSYGGGGEFFNVASRNDPYGKGVRLTDTFAKAGDEYVYLSKTVVPAINAMLAEANAGLPAAPEETGLPERPAFYARNGGKFVRRLYRRHAFTLLVGLAIVLACVRSGSMPGVLCGVALMAFTLVYPFSVTLDTAARTVRVGRCFGFLAGAAIPFDNLEEIETVRMKHNGIYTGTRVAMQFRDGKKEAPLGHFFTTGKIAPLIRETRRILGMASEGAENA